MTGWVAERVEVWFWGVEMGSTGVFKSVLKSKFDVRKGGALMGN